MQKDEYFHEWLVLPVNASSSHLGCAKVQVVDAQQVHILHMPAEETLQQAMLSIGGRCRDYELGCQCQTAQTAREAAAPICETARFQETAPFQMQADLAQQ